MRYILLFLTFTSCTSVWHFNKALKKQPNLMQEYSDTISIFIPQHDTIWMNDTFLIQTTYIKHDTIIDIKVIEPKTRYQIKTEYKVHRDTIRLIKYITKTEAKRDIKIQRTKSKWWIWLVVGFAGGVIVRRVLS